MRTRRNGGLVSWEILLFLRAIQIIKRQPYGVQLMMKPRSSIIHTSSTAPLKNHHVAVRNPFSRCLILGAPRLIPSLKISGTTVFRTNSSVPGAAWGKVNLTAKALTGGGFEALYKQTFTSTNPNEKLKKTFACYLSTTTGPVAGTLYLSDAHAAFCSDRPLSFTAPSGQGAWSYYKVMIPLSKIGTINPVVMRENQSERYIQIVTIDGHDFWFMGFVNYEKASRHLTESISSSVGSIAAEPMVV
ncbi:GEM-like protein 5 isoform X2 [Populus trichocarpa]|uniref:GEM-like protein 5 isoform X2 n=1 Tax=Populus trichocarpa TaxID=3694 RepID=UPI000D18B291|nr:GEM-like protein 5 isoform X2 [Populus trichocarpa]|eukprot:XP_024466121.1 GEM-like protein 5 isoform X2 [Populus trichocarpa]